MKIVFLDVDGVLNRLGDMPNNRTTERSKHGFIGMEKRLCAIVNRIITETGCKIVLSSSWRDGGGEGTREVEEALGIKFFGETPTGFMGFRGAQIQKFILDHSGSERYGWRDKISPIRIEKYAIIDDESDMYAFQPLFKTDYRTGITDELADEIIKYLNS